MTAGKRSFFVPKSRKTYGCEMPALAAIASVEAPSRPRAANSSSAASSTASRRSSADLRWVMTAIACKLLLTYYACQGLGDAIEIALGQARVERKRDRSIEDTGRAGKVALVTVGGEPVERVGADLGLDPLLAERCDHLGRPVDLDHIG